MSSNIKKPKLSHMQLIEKMKDKGITFNYFNEDKAARYILTHNNYLRLASYRKNYEKCLNGKNKGKYISLDFAYLKELSTIDMLLRRCLLEMCIDVEHCLKVELLLRLEFSSENGYDVVKSFFNEDANKYIIGSLISKIKSPHVGELIKKYIHKVSLDSMHDYIYHNNIDNIDEAYIIEMPVWVLIEVVSFGDFCRFYDHFYKIYDWEPADFSFIMCIKSLRNACAHNNCIIHDIHNGNTRSCDEIDKFLEKCEATGVSARSNLSCRPIYEIICLLYVYQKIATPSIKENGIKKLQDLFNNRMLRNKEYFENHQILSTRYKFLKKVLDKIADEVYNNPEIEKA